MSAKKQVKAEDDVSNDAEAGDSKDSSVNSNSKDSASPHSARPFQGVVACLTGMTSILKNQYHQAIEALGGAFTRDFHTSRNTHLIAETATGGKYDAAMAASKQIQVVQPSWLEACQQQNCRVDEKDFLWTRVNNKENGSRSQDEKNGDNRKRKHTQESSLSGKKSKQQQLVLSLNQALLLQAESPGGVASFPNPLFSSCQFYLVGFDTDVADAERTKLCRLLRRGMGTIYWDFHEGITHVIVHDQCDDAVR